MNRKLTITVMLARPFMRVFAGPSASAGSASSSIAQDVEASYRDMAADHAREQEAKEGREGSLRGIRTAHAGGTTRQDHAW